MRTVTLCSAVFDCNVLLQAAGRPNGPSGECLRLAKLGKVQLYISQETLTEISEVLARPKIRKIFPHLTDKIVATFLKSLRDSSQLVSKISSVFTYSRDVDDAPYINLAIAVSAEFIVSRDRDLLGLMTGHENESKEFRQRFRPLKIVDPATFINLIRAES